MASSNNNITAVHFSLIFFVMLSIILGVVAYMYIDESSRLRVTAKEKEDTERKVRGERDIALDELEALQKLAGYPGQFGLDSGAQDTAKAMLLKDIEKYGDGVNEVYATKIITLRSTLVNKQRQLKDLQQSMNDASQKFSEAINKAETDKNQVDKELANLKRSYAEEVAKTGKLEKDHQETLKVKDDNIASLQSARRQIQTQLDTTIAQHTEEMERKQKELDGLQSTVALKQQIIDNLLNVSFERPDGKVVSVDHRTKTVWIDLGSKDGLPDRMTFSVYSQGHQGIARDSNRHSQLMDLMDRDQQKSSNVANVGVENVSAQTDIKGAIEITRIQSNMAEARILKNDVFDPIRAGDPVYTPLWRPGQQESFAFAGVMDLDGDGSDDSELLHRTVEAAGAKVVAFTNDAGEIKGSRIDNDVKFLVVGDVPDPQESAEPAEKKIREARAASKLEMEKQARQRGVRIVRLADFLAYLGLEPGRRLWRPGEQAPRKLKAGSRSTAVDESLGDRSSSGQTSGIYSKRGRLKKQSGASTGRTSKIFPGR